MKLKEAQLLGIVALIAVAIILLCMWGGGHGSTEPTAADEQAKYIGGTDAEPAAADLAEDLAKEPGSSAGRQVASLGETKMTVGGTAPAAKPPSEESAIRTVIEECSSTQPGLTPPKEPAVPAAPGEVGAAKVHVVEAGETLDRISLKYYGTRHKWNEILDANKSVLSDPRKLHAGMKLTIPPLKAAPAVGLADSSAPAPALSATAPAPAAPAPAAAPKTAAARTYTVQKGDTLFRIAKKVYNDGAKWKDIQAANPDKTRDQRSLHAGVVLVIP